MYLNKTDDDTAKASQRIYQYRQLLGSLMYLVTSTRPDIMFAVSYLSQFCSAYGPEHWKAGKRVLRYLQKTKTRGLRFTNDGEPPFGVVDADWGSNPEDRRFQTGYAFIFGIAAISWESRKQKTVALSSTEAEYKALSSRESSRNYLLAEPFR